MAYGKNALNASFELKGLEKYLEMAQSLGKAIDDVATEAINASLAIIEKDMIAGAERHKDKGGVLKAIKVKKAKQSGGYIYGEVGIFVDENPEALHAVFQEFGDGHSPGFPDPFIRPSFDENKSEVKKIQRKILSGQDVPAISYKSENIIDGKHVSNKEMAEYRKWLKQSDAWFKMMGSKVEGGR